MITLISKSVPSQCPQGGNTLYYDHHHRHQLLLLFLIIQKFLKHIINKYFPVRCIFSKNSQRIFN